MSATKTSRASQVKAEKESRAADRFDFDPTRVPEMPDLIKSNEGARGIWERNVELVTSSGIVAREGVDEFVVYCLLQASIEDNAKRGNPLSASAVKEANVMRKRLFAPVDTEAPAGANKFKKNGSR